MITLVSILDPFSESNNKQFFEETDRPLYYYLKNTVFNHPGMDYSCTIKNNSEIVEVDIKEDTNFKVKDGSIICVCANIKDPATITAVITGIASFGAAVEAGAAAAALYAGVYLATTFAIGYGLNLIASALAPDAPSTATTSSGSVDQAYGWSDLYQTENEGNRIPYIFGTNKVTGQVINQFITVDDNDEILNILLGLCDHELDSITNIELNSQDAATYEDVITYTRLGSLSDTVIDTFSDVVTQTSVNSRLTKDKGVVVRTGGNSVEKIRIFITATNGLYYSNDSGGLDFRSAIYTIEYRAVGDASWTLFDTITQSSATTEALRFTHDIESLTPNQYDVRVTRTIDEEASYRGSSVIYFSLFQEIITNDFLYPGLAKLGIVALATDQISGNVPSITCIASRNYVSVYNENSGYWEDKRATSPAWITYSLLNEFAGISPDKIVWDDFELWADYCDEIVDDDYRFIVNVICYDSNFWSEIQRVAKLGRATIIRRGTRYGVFIDKEDTTVTDMFSMGNIIQDSFSVQYLPKKDRANAVEIEYSDVDRDYTRQVITIYDDDYLDNTNTDPKKSNVSFQASMTQSQAVREGVYRINSNRFLKEVITFDAFVDSFAATVGDLIYFQHQIPNYGISFGGRIIDAGNDDGSGNPYVQIDRNFVIESGKSYAIRVRLRDNSFVEKLITNSPETTDTFTLSTSWSTVPTIVLGREQPVYSLGDVNEYTEIYRLTSCTRKDDFIRTLTAVKYVNEIYTNNDGFIIEELSDITTEQKVSSLIVTENVIFTEFSTYQSSISVYWEFLQNNNSSWVVWLKDITAGTSAQKILTTSKNTATITSSYLVKNHTYRIYVNTENEGLFNYFSNTALVTIQGKDILPDDIDTFFIQNNQLVWEYPGSSSEIAGFKLKSGIGSNVSWTYAEYENNGNFVTSPYSVNLTGETTTYLIKAFDYDGNESEFPATIITSLGDILTSNVVEETTLAPPFDGDITNGTVIGDVLYANNDGDFWSGTSSNNIWKGVSGEVFFDSQYLNLTYVDTFTPVYENVPVIISVDASADTGFLIFYREFQPSNFWSGNSGNLFWSGNSSESFWEGSGMSDYRLVPNPVNLTLQPYQLKITTNSGSNISNINGIEISYDFPDVEESLEDISISATGTRLPITKSYQVIKNVSLTLQDTGSTAVSVEIVDKNATTGPLIKIYDSSKVLTTGIIDARIQGY